MNEPHVWYAAFGSNLMAERFHVYLTGGAIPLSTTGRVQRGARNPALPSGDQPFHLERSLLFSGASAQWGGGGTATIDAHHNPISPTMARVFRITLGQFEDVFAQENGLAQPVAVELGPLQAGTVDLTDRKYGRVERVGEIDGEPVVTLASPAPPAALTTADLSYLTVMGRGLMQSWNVTARAAADYLASRPGNAGFVDPGILATTLA